MTFVVVAHYRSVPDQVDAVTSALVSMVGPTRAEPGNVSYQVHRSLTAPSEFVLVEEYVDQAAFQAHLATAHFVEHLAGVVLPRLESRTRFDLEPLGPTVS